MSSATLMLCSPLPSVANSDHPTPRALLDWAYQTQSERQTPVLVLPRGVSLTPSFFADLVKAFSTWSLTSGRRSSEDHESLQWNGAFEGRMPHEREVTDLPTRLAIEVCSRRVGIWSLLGLGGVAERMRISKAQEEMKRASGKTTCSITRCLLPSRPMPCNEKLLIAIAEDGTDLPGWTESLNLTIDPS